MALCGPHSWLSARRRYGFTPFSLTWSALSVPWLAKDQAPFAVW